MTGAAAIEKLRARLQIPAGQHNHATIAMFQTDVERIALEPKAFEELQLREEHRFWCAAAARKKDDRGPCNCDSPRRSGVGWKREERLICIVKVSKFMLGRMEILSKRVGRCVSKKLCFGVTESEIQEGTGLTRWEVNRAIGDLLWAKYIVSEQPCEEYTNEDDEKKWAGWAAVRTFTARFFQKIGRVLKLAATQAEKYRELKKGKRRPAELDDDNARTVHRVAGIVRQTGAMKRTALPEWYSGPPPEPWPDKPS